MPWASKEQERWGNSPAGHKALGNKGVAEFNEASKGKDLPKKTHDHQKGKWKSAAHLGEHMGKMNDTGDTTHE